MKIIEYDHVVPYSRDEVVSFAIQDPLKPKSSSVYCIGFKFIGGNPLEITSYEYDHTNLHDSDRCEKDPIPVNKKRIESLVKAQGTDLSQLLLEYLALISKLG